MTSINIYFESMKYHYISQGDNAMMRWCDNDNATLPLLHCRHRIVTIALSPSHYRIVALWFIMYNHDGPNGILYYSDSLLPYLLVQLIGLQSWKKHYVKLVKPITPNSLGYIPIDHVHHFSYLWFSANGGNNIKVKRNSMPGTGFLVVSFVMDLLTSMMNGKLKKNCVNMSKTILVLRTTFYASIHFMIYELADLLLA